MRRLSPFAVVVLAAVSSAVAADYPRKDLLVEPAALAEGTAGFAILDARPRAAYDAGHVPGAVWVDHAAWEKGFYADEDRDPAAWAAKAAELGLSNDMPIVVYDDNLSKDAARVWWALTFLGAKDARLLNGGWKGWTAARLPTTEVEPTVAAGDFRPAPQADRFRDKAGVLAELESGGGWQIVDARSEDEHCGEDLLTNARGGAIPGAKHLEWSDLLDKATNRFKPADEIARLFAEAGIDPAKPTVTHCQSGGRASVMAFGLELMGGTRVANYYRGWKEWGNTAETPVAVPTKE